MAGSKAKAKAAAVDAMAINFNHLKTIVDAGESGIHTPVAVHTPLIAEGLVEINSAAVDADGNVQTRATAKGIETMQLREGETASAVAPAASGFKIVTGVPMPKLAGRGRSAGEQMYPFDDLPAEGSFFVPNSESKPDAAKSLASTVSTANRRHSEVVEGETKQVAVKQYARDAEGKRTKDESGAYVLTGPDVVETVPATRQLRHFVVRPVEDGAAWGDEFKGVAGAAVWRDL